jgi:hypothetical protein
MLLAVRETPVDPDQIAAPLPTRGRGWILMPVLIWIKPPVNGVINIILPVVLGEEATY